MKNFDRAREDVGNILLLEHVNLRVPDQSLATLFYVNGLGFTRDPFIDFGPVNVWINVGKQQFHLPTGKPQKLRGEIGVRIPDIDGLLSRLARLQSKLAGSEFKFVQNDDQVMVTCPWGNKIRCLEGTIEMPLGIPYIEFHVPENTSAGIAGFYEDIFDVKVKRNKTSCEVSIGIDQCLKFREMSEVPAYDGHHIAIYTPHFSKPYRRIKDKGFIMEESDQHQYRFKQLFRLEDNQALYEIEHEVRSLVHPMYNRPLVNRNAGQSFSHYTRGQDAFYP